MTTLTSDTNGKGVPKTTLRLGHLLEGLTESLRAAVLTVVIYHNKGFRSQSARGRGIDTGAEARRVPHRAPGVPSQWGRGHADSSQQ